MTLLTMDQAKERYGEIANGAWANEGDWCFIIQVPEKLQGVVNSASGKPWVHVYVNKDMAAPLQRALQNVIDRGLEGELKTFDGCFEIRDVRAMPGCPSWHSYAMAIDFNASTNKLGTDGDMSDELAVCFTDAGFVWGKTFHRKDPMHFQFAIG